MGCFVNLPQFFRLGMRYVNFPASFSYKLKYQLYFSQPQYTAILRPCQSRCYFNAQFTLDMLAAGRIVGKPVIAKLYGVTEPTVDSTVEEFVVQMDEYRERNRRRFIDK